MQWIRTGITRDVFVFRDRAVKVPSLRTWRHFIQGILCNLNERDWWAATRSDLLCPVTFCFAGLVLVMKRADALTPAGEYEEGFGILDEERVKSFVLQWRGYPIEPKPESFGVLSGRIVAIDYGDDLARRASGLTDWEPKA